MKTDKTIEETTKVSEEKYHALFDSNRDGISIFRLNSEGKAENFIETNAATAEIYGYTKEEILTMNISDLESSSQKIRKQRIETLQFNGKSDFETIIKTKKGKSRNVEVKLLIINYLNEPAVMIITRDITERKQIELNAKKAQENLLTILEAIPDLLFEVDQHGLIHHYQAHRLDLLAASPEFFMGKRFQDVIPAEAANVCMAAIDEAAKNGWSSGKQYSLDLAKGKHWFELSVSTIKESNPKERHFIILARDITERKVAEIALRENQEKLLGVFNLANSGIVMTDTKGNFILFNDWCCETLGYTREEFSHLNSSIITHPEDYEQSKLFRENLNKGKINKYQIIKRYVRKDKSFFWCELSASSIKDENNNVVNIIKIIIDITERKKAEENLKQSEERLINAQAVAKIGSWETDFSFTNAIWSKENGIIFGLNPDATKLSLEEFLSIIHPEDRILVETSFVHSIKTNTVNSLQHRIITAAGIKKIVEQRWEIIRDYQGQPYKAVGTCQDITERKLIELELENEKRRLAYILIGTDAGTWEWNIQTGDTIYNERWANMIGYTLEELSPVTIDTWKKFSHPDDLVKSNLLLEKYLNGEINFYECESRMKHKNGDWIWVLDRGKVNKWDFNGNPLLISGTHQDITERKLAEEKLKITSEKLRHLVNSTGGIVWEADAKTFNFTFVSEQAERLLGYATTEWQSPNFWVNHLHPEDKEHTIEYCVGQTNQMKAHNFTYRFRAKDGKYIWLRDIVNVVVEDGKPQLVRGVMFDITEQKENEDSLRENEEKYRGLVEGSPYAIVIYIDDKIAYINDEGLRMAGAKNREEIINKPVLQFVHPDSLADVIQYMEEVTRVQNASRIVEERFISLKGVAFDVEIKAIPTIYERKNAVQVIVHDITERKRTEEKIRQLSQAVEQSPVAIIITNTKGKIEYANPKFIETSGYTLEEVIHQNPRILKSGHTSPNEYKDLWQTISSGKEWHGEFHNKKKDGSLYWESASISPIVNSEGKITHFIAIKEDITNRKNAEKDLIKAKLRAEESDRLKLAFLANMSHEIRTPMNGILGFTELLKAPNLGGEEQQEYIRIIEKSGIRMLNIINDIINISKVESGQIEISLSETNLNEQIEYLYTFFKPESKQKGLLLSITKKLAATESIITTDREKVYAILTNLVKNAVKFTDSGFIEFGCSKKGNFIEFYIKDSGFGISESQKKIIFERFRRGNETITRTHEGSGLGLAISKAYVEILGGKIWVESEQGKGSTFYFTIPANTKLKSLEKVPAKSKSSSEEKEENQIKDLKVLIVEDDEISKLLITIAVKKFSKEILKVGTGFEAIEACRNNPDIDLVMMDINMPEMGGYEATEQIRKFNKDVVIIAQTANGMQSDRDEAIAAGCTDYVSKPVNIASLSALIHKYFKS